MKRLLLSGLLLLALGAYVLIATGARNPPSTDPTYKVELDNAFGLVNGASFKVAGVTAGTISSIDLDQKTLHAVVTIKVTAPGVGEFHSDVFCLSRPQSLIGEYFISCDPGSKGATLPSGSTIPVSRTQSTIPADLLLDITRLPERQRLPLIIGELGAAVAGRSGDLQAALRRAVPAIDQTDNLLNLLAGDSGTIEQLTASSNQVITELANNSGKVQRFIVEANRAAGATATQQANLRTALARLPAFLEQLRPAMAHLGAATDANTPVLANLNASATRVDRLLTDLPSFSRAALPAVRTLGRASITGRTAVQAAKPTIGLLNQFARPTPELAQNLSIILPDLDSRAKATETNPRSPGGKGYTGLESLLQFVFNLAGATNTYGPYGHQLAIDAFVSAMCSSYATPATVATGLKTFGAAYRSCYAFLGPNQPGVTTADPSNPSACVPDPGGAPPGLQGAASSVCKLAAATDRGPRRAARGASHRRSSPAHQPATPTTSPAAPPTSQGGAPSGGSSGAGGSGAGGGLGGALNGVGQTLGKVLQLLGGGSAPQSSGGGSTTTTPAPTTTTTSSGAGGAGGSGVGQSVQNLLNYLLSP